MAIASASQHESCFLPWTTLCSLLACSNLIECALLDRYDRGHYADWSYLDVVNEIGSMPPWPTEHVGHNPMKRKDH